MNKAVRAIAIAAVLWTGFGAASGALAQAQRSAQSDCAREAERRGYTTLSARNFQQYKDGWSLELQARDTAGRVSWGSCFVETRTGDVSLYGFGWSGGDGAGNAGNLFEFNCSSTEGKYRECQLPVDGRARLIKQKSDSPCIQGQSWGQRGDRVWVDRGCRARFEVTFGGSGAGQRVECRSEQQRYRECPIARGYVGRLVGDESGGKCRNAGAWGTRDGVVWVDLGCKGRFELVRSGGSGGSGSGGGNPRPAAARGGPVPQPGGAGRCVRARYPACGAARFVLGDDHRRREGRHAGATDLPFLSGRESRGTLLSRQLRCRLEWRRLAPGTARSAPGSVSRHSVEPI